MAKLICFDMDGVIFEHTNFWMELHRAFGTYEEGVALTRRYLKTNYAELVEEVVGRLWKGKSESKFMDVVNSIKYVAGAKELFSWLNGHGYKTAIISTGSKRLAERAKEDLGVGYIYTNELVFKDGKVSGEFKWPLAADRKGVVFRQLCEEHHIFFSDCIVVAHDDFDIKMARTAGFTIGFCPEDGEIRRYCNVIVTKKDLRELIPILEEREANL